MKNKLKVYRAMRDLTQEQLADKIGVSRQTVIAIESDKYLPSLGLAFKIARLFKVTIEDIFFLKEVKMKINLLKEKLFYAVAVGISIFLLFFFIGCAWIGYEAKTLCQNAKWEYGGDCVEALIAQLNDEHQGFRIRNHAIWALGQFGDSRALPVLQSNYTGNIPAREPLDGTISQYELKKAVNLTSGGLNITAFLWRGFLNKK